MGRNLALNIANNGYSVAVYNRTASRTKDFLEGAAVGKSVIGAYSVPDLINSLEKPRAILLMIQAGEAVDDIIQQLVPYLTKNDIIIDAGNSFFKDTERRGTDLEKIGVRYVGVGISGGEEGALKGPCIMAGGPKEAYNHVQPILTKIAAKITEGSCCAYLGPGGAGHYVKMVHNGIEYAILQLIAETYDLLTTGLGLSIDEVHDIFAKWNRGELGSYIMEISVAVTGRRDDETGKPLLELILDEAEQKGTGKWASQSGLELGVPIPSIDAAVSTRVMSSLKDERVKMAKVLGKPTKRFPVNKDELITKVRDALYCSSIIAYAQGMALLRAASQRYSYGLNLETIAQIWKGGCIIRSKLLNVIDAAYRRNPNLNNLLLDSDVSMLLLELEDNWRSAVRAALELAISSPVFCASINYFYSYRRERLPSNIIQALRDCFGAHGYRRTDKSGVYHTQWT